jgi:hypothetical protein
MGRLLHVYRKARCVLVREAKRPGSICVRATRGWANERCRSKGCIAKGKEHKKYEFGCKVSVATTSKRGWVVGIKALHGNPYDGHTLKAAHAQVEKLTGVKTTEIFVDRGYRGLLVGSGFNLRKLLRVSLAFSRLVQASRANQSSVASGCLICYLNPKRICLI